MGERTKPYAGCPVCSSPLISTLEMRGHEWICVPCDRWFGWMSARAREVSPEADAEYVANKAGYDAARKARQEAAS